MEEGFPLDYLNKLAEEDALMLDHPPVVDAVVFYAWPKNVTLPMDDSTSFKDPLDRRIDNVLKIKP